MIEVDVLKHDACNKLEKWFNDRWSDRWCVEISDELAAVIDESWAREQPIPPYHIYLTASINFRNAALLIAEPVTFFHSK